MSYSLCISIHGCRCVDVKCRRRAGPQKICVFLPVHFWVLGLAIRGEAALDGALIWSDQPLVKLAEAALIVLLAAHLTGGVRLLALEFLPWCDWQKTLAAVTGGLSLAAGLLFLVNVF